MIHDSTYAALAAGRRSTLRAEADAARLVREARAGAPRRTLLRQLLSRRRPTAATPVPALPAPRPAPADDAAATAQAARSARAATPAGASC